MTRSSSTARGPAPTRSTRSAGATSASPCTTSATSARGSADRGPRDLPPDYLLATAGGGVDGYPLLSRFVEALRLRPLPLPAVVVTGPLMPAAELARLRERAAGLDARVEQFREDMDSVIVGARAVVSMAGYNTVSELLIAGKPGLIVPGLRPTEEQMMRAEMLAASGLVGVLDPETLDPKSMRAALDRLLESPPPRVEPGHYQGAARATAIVTALAEGGPADPDRSQTATVAAEPLAGGVEAARNMSPVDARNRDDRRDDGAPHVHWRRSVRLLRPFFTRNWGALGGASAATVLATVATLAQPWPLALVIDELLGAHDGAFTLTTRRLPPSSPSSPGSCSRSRR